LASINSVPYSGSAYIDPPCASSATMCGIEIMQRCGGKGATLPAAGKYAKCCEYVAAPQQM
jgi:hypothetical protein